MRRIFLTVANIDDRAGPDPPGGLHADQHLLADETRTIGCPGDEAAKLTATRMDGNIRTSIGNAPLPDGTREA